MLKCNSRHLLTFSYELIPIAGLSYNPTSVKSRISNIYIKFGLFPKQRFSQVPLISISKQICFCQFVSSVSVINLE